MKEIAVYGGTFDPPTKAHEAIIEMCLSDVRFDEVWVMPSGQRTDKPDMTSNEHRTAMLGLLATGVFGSSNLRISDFEMKLPVPTQTTLTITALEKANPNCNFWYVFGADSYYDMPNWVNGGDLQKKLGMLVVERVGYDTPPEARNVRHLKLTDEQRKLLRADISSTNIRKLVRKGVKGIDYLNADIHNYIKQHNLYL